jgi:ethanolamine utilization protein EutA (predicted chaperonin)
MQCQPRGKKHGVSLIDIGGGTTDLAIFKDGYHSSYQVVALRKRYLWTILKRVVLLSKTSTTKSKIWLHGLEKIKIVRS